MEKLGEKGDNPAMIKDLVFAALFFLFGFFAGANWVYRYWLEFMEEFKNGRRD